MSTSSGIGQSARLCYRALQEIGLSPRAFDLGQRFKNADMAWKATNQAPPCEDEGELILHANAPEVVAALSAIGRERTRHRRLIGYWAWELPTFPSGWDSFSDSLHEIWVPSRFVRDSLEKHCGLPIKIVPHPIFLPVASPYPRRNWGWPDDEFIVLSMFDMRSSFYRKNPIGAVRAFTQAFASTPKVRLIIKVGNAMAFPEQMNQLNAEIGTAHNIHLLTTVYDQNRIADLISAADVILSLHRSEGFGLTLAEAMAHGKPVIATGWSGNTDFMTRENCGLVGYEMKEVYDPGGPYEAHDTEWAEPNIEDAANWLRELHRSPDLRRALGERAHAAIIASCGLAAYERAYREALA
jgi:glycosyltransferase involved in cell wall biosynthesis